MVAARTVIVAPGSGKDVGDCVGKLQAAMAKTRMKIAKNVLFVRVIFPPNIDDKVYLLLYEFIMTWNQLNENRFSLCILTYSLFTYLAKVLNFCKAVLCIMVLTLFEGI
jgi:hypothetical protein